MSAQETEGDVEKIMRGMRDEKEGVDEEGKRE